MTQPTIVYPDVDYPSYTDFKRLVQIAGYPTCTVEEMDVDDPSKCYIIVPVYIEWPDGWPDAKARLIIWDMEWRDEKIEVPGVSEVWASDPWYAQRNDARFVLLGSHPDLNPCPEDRNGEFDYDVAMLAIMTRRRYPVQGHLVITHQRRIAPNGWGEERHRILSRSRVMLHVHQHDAYHTIAPQRFALAAAYHMPTFSEAVNQRIDVLNDRVIYGKYDILPHLVNKFLDYDAGLKALGESLYQTLCVEHTFQREVEAAL